MPLIRSRGEGKSSEPLAQTQGQQDAILDRQPSDALPLQLLRARDAAAGAGAMSEMR
jgi:hypothetical protein